MNECPKVQALVLLGKTGECHKLIRLVKDWWPNNWESAQSVVAINVCCPQWLSYSRSGDFLWHSSPPRVWPPLGRSTVPACAESHPRGVAWMPHMETALPWSRVLERRHGYLPIWGSFVHVRPNINTLAGIHLSLGILEKVFYGLRDVWVIRKVSQLWQWTLAAV